MSEDKFCQSCGMPMRNQQDFGGGLLDNPYCVYCTDAEGKLKPYEVVLENMKNFAIRTMGVSEAEALKIAQEGMAKQPAWQNISQW
jgi:hypothetical protein